MSEHAEFIDEDPRSDEGRETVGLPSESVDTVAVTGVPPAGTGRLTTEATELSEEDRLIFQSHWDEFAGHIN